MKIKFKPLLIASGVILAATITTAVGLSYIPVGDKKLEKSQDLKNIKEEHSDTKIPGIPKVEYKEKTKKTPKDIELKNREYSPNVIDINSKVDYVALGDSISAGFDANLDKDYPGEYDQSSKELTGISFPVYLASYINQISSNKLNSFNNFARSGSSFKD
ncbi:UNVERIFIED_CONTAM: hypothetical protein O8I53_08025 [Campylobacter lari]